MSLKQFEQSGRSVLKVVIDTNLFVSSIINKSGTPAKLLQAWRDHAYLLIISSRTLEEVIRVLQYPRIKNRYNLKNDEIEQAIDTIQRFAIVLHDLENLNVIREDPDDNIVLACAIAAEADCIVSGDAHLLNLGKFKGIPIVTAKDFLKNMESKIK